MTAIVAGQGLGLFNTSANVLGGQGGIGVASQGRSGEQVVVNATTGNLVVQQQDEWLVGVGPDVGAKRTYNSLGGADGDNNDKWRLGLNRKITGFVSGSKVVRVGEDGQEQTYDWNATLGLYVNKDGAGSFDTLKLESTVWTWTDGDTRTVETYEITNATTKDARLQKITDADAKVVTLGYDATSGMLKTAKTSNGETLEFTYENSSVTGQPTRIKSVLLKNAGNATYFKRVTYDYDSSDRLWKVTVDLSPEDQSTADAKTYVTEYLYYDGTKQLRYLRQQDGSELEFKYDAGGKVEWIKELVTPGATPEVRQTSFSYNGNVTRVTDASGQVTELTYRNTAGVAYGQLERISRPLVGGSAPVIRFDYDADGNVKTVTDERGYVTQYRYDASGNRIFEEDAQGNVVERTFSAANQLLSETVYSGRDTDADGGASGAQTTYYVYDTAKPTQLRYVVSADGRVTRYDYDAGTGQRTAKFQYLNNTLSSWRQDFSQDTTGLSTVAGFAWSATSRRLEYVATTTASSASTSSSATAALGSLWSMEVSTPAGGIGQDLLFAGLESGTAATASFRRLRLRLSNGQFYTEQQSGTSANAAVLLGAAGAGKTYVVEFDTRADGSMVLYVYEKGKPRSAGLQKTFAADAGWTAPKLYIQGNSGASAIAGTVAVDNIAAQLRPTLGELNTWVGQTDKTAWVRTAYGYDERGQVSSEITYGRTDAAGNGEETPWDQESWSDEYTQYVYDQSGNLKQKIDLTKVWAMTASNNSSSMEQRRLWGVVYGANDPNGVQGEPKKVEHLTAQDLALLEAKATYKTEYVYDGLNRITSETDGLGNLTKTTYLDASRGLQVDMANGLTRVSTYDRAGRLIYQSQYAASAPATSLGAKEYTYDKMGRLTSTKEVSTGERSYILYDALGRKVADIDAEGALTEYRYNDAGQLTGTIGYTLKVSSAVLAALAADPSQAGLSASMLTANLSLWTQPVSHAAITSGINTPTNATANKALLAGDYTRWLKQTGADTGLSSYIQSEAVALPATGSRRLEVSAYVGVVNASASIEVQFFNTTTVTSTTVPASTVVTGASTSAAPKAGGVAFGDYEKLQAYVDIPAGAVMARLVVRKSGSSAAESYMYVTHPVLAQAAAPTATMSKSFALLDVRPPLAAGDRMSWNVYDKAGRLAMVLSSRGNGANGLDEYLSVKEMRYDGAGRLTDTIEYANPLYSTSAKALRRGGVEVQVPANGQISIDGTLTVLTPDSAYDRRTRNYYSAEGLLIGQLDAENYYTQYAYNGAGLLQTLTRYAKAVAEPIPEDGAPPKVSPSYFVFNLNDLAAGVDRTTRYYYNGRKQLIGEVDAEGYYTAYQYDATGNKSHQTRYANTVSNLITNSTPPLVLSAAPAGSAAFVLTSSEDQTTQYFYDADNRLARSLEKPANVVSTFEYDKAGNLVRAVRALGTDDERTALKRYDAAGRLVGELSAEGAKALVGKTLQADIDLVWKNYGTEHRYDAAGRRVATIEPDGSANSAGNKTLFYYDKVGRLTHSINALGEVTQYTYNAFGNQSEVRQVGTRLSGAVLGTLNGGLNTALGTNVSSLLNSSLDAYVARLYNRAGQERYSSDQMRNVTYSNYGVFGDLESLQRPDTGVHTEWMGYEYDRRGRLMAAHQVTEDGILRSNLTQYNAFGQLMKATDARGNVTLYLNDRLGRTYAVTNPNSQMFGVTTTYDAFNRVVIQRDRNGQETTYAYDSANRTVKITTPEGAAASVTYQSTQVMNRHGQTVSVTDGRGTYTQYTYDADGQLTNTTVKKSATGIALSNDSLTYDKAGRVSTRSSTTGMLTSYEYDKANRVLKQTQTDTWSGQSYTSEYRYDALGRAVWKKDQAGVWTQTEFDLTGRVTAVVVNPASIPSSQQATNELNITLVANPDTGSDVGLRTTFDYDERGQLRFITEGAGSSQPKKTEYRYDAAGRREYEIVDPDNLQLTTQYVYDGNDNVVARIAKGATAALDRTTRYVYDASNRVAFEVDATGAVTQTEYDPQGNVSRVTAYAKRIDLSGVLLGLLTAADITSRTGAPSASVDQVTRYVYDANNRLQLSVDALGYGTRYEYDQAGNVVVKTRYATKAPALTEASDEGTLRYTVDMAALKAIGNDSIDQVDQYTYDGLGRVTGHVDAEGGYTETYYNPYNAREIRTTRYANALVYPSTVTEPAVKNRLLPNKAPLKTTSVPNAATILEPTLQTSGGTAGKDVTTYTWTDGLGRTTATRDGEGYQVHYVLDALGRVIKRFDEAGNTTRNVYDSAGRLVISGDARGTLTKNTYDAAGRLTQSSQHDNAQGALDMGVNLGADGALARNLGSFNAGDQVTVTVWVKADDNMIGKMTLGNQAGTLQDVKEAWGTRDMDDGWQMVTLSFTPTATMDVWLTLKGDPSTAGKDRFVMYDDITASVKRNGTNTTTQLFIDSFYNSNINAALSNYTATGSVSRIEYLYNVGDDASYEFMAATTAASRLSTYTYDTAGRLLEQTQAKGKAEEATTRYVLNAFGQQEKIIDPRGIAAATATTDWAIDERARILGRDRSLCLSAPVKDSADYNAILAAYTTTNVFDNEGRVTESRDPLGGTTRTNYDAFGNAIRIQDPNGNYGYFVFDQLNQATWQIDPMGYATQTQYNGLGQVEQIVKYDSAVVNQHNIWSDTTKTVQAPLTDNTSASLPYLVKNATKDATTSIAHDRAGRQTKITDAEGYFESMSYDALGNKKTYTAKSNTATKVAGGLYSYEYDRRGQLKQETLPVKVKQYDATTGAETSSGNAVINKYEYDARGNRTKSIEAAGLQEQRTTTYKFDLLNRQTEQTGQEMDVFTADGVGERKATPTESRKYDASGNLIEVKAADGARTLMYYDALGRKVSEVGPTGMMTAYTYDAAGNVVVQRVYGDAVALPASVGSTAPTPVNASNYRETRFTFNANGLQTSQTIVGNNKLQVGEINPKTGNFELRSQDLVSRKTYDASGNTVSETDARGNTIWRYYNKAGQMVAQVDAERYLSVYNYDAGGHVTGETRYGSKIKDSFVLKAGYSVTELTAALLATDNRKTDWAFDKLGRLTTHTVYGVESATVNSTNGALTVNTTANAVTSYEYNGLGQVVRKTEATTDVLDWIFDELGRETSKLGAKFTDFEGKTDARQVTKTEYNALGQLKLQTRAGKVTADDRHTWYFYGANGVLLREEQDTSATQRIATRYQYDLGGRVASKAMDRTNAAGTVSTDITTYLYDQRGAQLKQTTYNLTGAGAKLLNNTTYTALQTVEARYSVYGEVINRRTYASTAPAADSWQEFAEFDVAGRMIKGNAGDGVTKVYVYDANGNATATITNKTTNLATVSVSDAVKAADAIRTFQVFDRRNSVVETIESAASTTPAATPVSSTDPAWQAGSNLQVTLGATPVSANTEVNPLQQGSMGALAGVVQVGTTFRGDYPRWYYQCSVNVPDNSAMGNGKLRVVVQLVDMRYSTPEAPVYGYFVYYVDGLVNGGTWSGPEEWIGILQIFSGGAVNVVYQYVPREVYIEKEGPNGYSRLATVSAYFDDGINNGEDYFKQGTINHAELFETLSVTGQPQGTKKVVANYRKSLSNDAWKRIEMPYDAASSGYSVWLTDYFGDGQYDIVYSALDEAGNVLNQQSASLNVAGLSSTTFQELKANYKATAVQQPSDGNPKISALYENDGITTGILTMGLKGQPPSATVKFRKKGTTTWSQDFNLSPVTIGASAAAGMFRFVPTDAVYGLTDTAAQYEYVLSTKTSGGATIERVLGEFKLNDPNSVKTNPSYLNELATTVHFQNLPKDAASVRVLYRTTGTQNAWTSQTLDRRESGSFDWITFETVVQNGSSTYPLDYEVQAFDASGRLIHDSTGKVKVGAVNEMVASSTANAMPAAGTVAFKPPVAAGATPVTLKLYYRSAGSTGAFSVTPLTASVGTNGVFSVNVSSLLPSTSQSGQWEYYYEVFDGVPTKLSDSAQPTSAAPARLDLSSTTAGATPQAYLLGIGSATQYAHATQKVNAYGEVVEQMDALGRKTTLRYNAMGKLVEKTDPQVSVTGKDGVVRTNQTLSTKYFYDLQGRVVGTEDARGAAYRNTVLLVNAGEGQTLVAKEFHADGGIKRNGYDVFGDQRYSANELSTSDADTTYRTTFEYDKLSRLIKQLKPLRENASLAAFDLYAYDEAGNRIRHQTSADGTQAGQYFYTDTADYDALGRVTYTNSAANRWMRYDYVYDATITGVGGAVVGGWKLTTTNKNTQNNVLVDYADIFGHQAKHIDLGLRTFTYTYNTAGWLTKQVGSNGQDIDYAYYNNGRIKSLMDNTAKSYTLYKYDLVGNKTYEGYATKSGVNWTYYQQATISYDALNRITGVVDPQYRINYEYDEVGNRRHLTAYKGTSQTATQDYWYDYDKMNRFTVTMGKLEGGAVVRGTGGDGVAVEYDALGQRKVVYVARDNHREDYEYSRDGFLTKSYSGTNLTAKNALVSDRIADHLGRVTTYKQTGSPDRVFEYDGDGKTTKDTYDGAVTEYIMHNDGTLKQTKTTKNSAVTNTYYAYEWWDEGKQKAITSQEYNPQINKNQNAWKPGTSYFEYDVNGHAKIVEDVVGGRVLRYATNAQGLILVRDEITSAGKINKSQKFFYFDGARIGEVGNDASAANVDYAQALAQKPVDRKTAYKNWKPVSTSDFDQNYTPISPTYPGFTAAGYTVQTSGITLQQVAQAVWGDSSLWYMLADANGLTSTTPLTQGQTLVIPNKVTNIHNNSTTKAVYNAAEAMGDVMPTLPEPPPPPKKKCGGLGVVLMVVVAIAAAAFVGPAVLGMLSSYATIGAAVASGTLGGVAAGLTAAAVGAAAGSVASQLVGMATGDVEKFSWSQVGRAAVMGAVSAGATALANSSGLYNLDAAGKTTSVWGSMGQAAMSNAISQQIARGIGLQPGKFSWTSVAASAVAAGASYEFDNSSLGKAMAGIGDGGILSRTASGMVSGWAGSMARHEKPHWQSIAANAFGNAVGEAVRPYAEKAGYAFGQSVGDAVVAAFVKKDETRQERARAWVNSMSEADLRGMADNLGQQYAKQVVEVPQLASAGTATTSDAGSLSAGYSSDEALAKQGANLADQLKGYWAALKDGTQAQIDAIKSDIDTLVPGRAKAFEVLTESLPEIQSAIKQELVNEAPAIAKDVLLAVGGALLAEFTGGASAVFGAARAIERGAKTAELLKGTYQAIQGANEVLRGLSGVLNEQGVTEGLQAAMVGVLSKTAQKEGLDTVEALILKYGAKALPGIEDAAVQKILGGVMAKADNAINSASAGFTKKSPILGAIVNAVYRHGDVAEKVTGFVLEHSGLFSTEYIPGTKTKEIGSIQNRSGHGIDFIGRALTGDSAGKFIAVEVKGGLNGMAKGLAGDQQRGADYFVRTRIDRAIAALGPWGAVPNGTRDFAAHVKREMTGMGSYAGQLVQHNYMRAGAQVRWSPWN
ncbi:MAG: hypothetical protein QM742_11985 [Aquabacterium sp.]